MPRSLTKRLETDEAFRKRMLKTVQDYVAFSRTSLDYYTADFDAAHDLLMCYSTLKKSDIVSISKGNPRKFVLPITATHIHTMTSYIVQALFGDGAPHKVGPGGPEDDSPARLMNELLKWNSEQQSAGMFQLGYQWVETALTYNRGIMYDCVQPIFKERWVSVQIPKVDPVTKETEVDPVTGQPVMVEDVRKEKIPVGRYCRVELVSPYDFFIDPLVPLYRGQEGRYMGHRIVKPWTELQGRSLLNEDDPMFLSPRAVTELKKKPSKGFGYPAAASTSGGTSGNTTSSRTAYERNRGSNPTDSRVDSKDPGIVDFHEMWVRLVPKDYEIDERTDPQIFQITMGNEREVLSINESTYEHGAFPYSIGEPRPSPFYQFSPSWVMMLKNIQDYVDYLKDRHQEAITRTVGNVFIAKANLIDIRDFEDPEKEGKFITVLPEAASMPLNDVIRQVPITDLTANFMGEMRGFVAFAESTSGASSQMQGQVTGSSSDATATAASLAATGGTGRLSMIARLLSVQGIVPQTKRLASNFQQFYDGEMQRRITGDMLAVEGSSEGVVKITPDSIQGSFDFRAHDGMLPGTDTKKVAALARIIELMPVFPQMFQPEVGNIDPKKVFMDGIRVAGGKPESYLYRQEDIARLAQQMAEAAVVQSQVPGVLAGPGGAQQGAPVNPLTPPGPAGATPGLAPVGLPNPEGDPQARPGNV